MKNNINQKTFIQGLRSFKDVLPKNIKKVFNKKGHAYLEILTNWKYFVGEKISKISSPESLKPVSKNDSGTLFVNVIRGNEVDLEYKKKIFIEKINSYFGYKIINNLSLKVSNEIVKESNQLTKKFSNKTKERFKKNLNAVQNTNLKKSLSKLISSIK